ncbi:hypothetical protein ACFY04_28085 [Streptomyces sp. NPDC001549]|uniref:hypothetical protein n=1 Tax=Streptomyces sp. NPDC001549 TaxID=3364586 RepID=UPI0036987994
MATAVLAAVVLAGCSAQGAPQEHAARPADAGTAQPRAAKPSSEGKTGPLEYGGKAIPEEGCPGQSILDFRKDYEHPQAVETARRISSRSYQDSLARPEVQAAFQKWSARMKEKGYTYASPMDPPAVEKFQDGPVTDGEKATAQADVACKARTGLLNSWFTAEAEIQQTKIAVDAKVLQELRELHLKKVAAARTILTEA